MFYRHFECFTLFCVSHPIRAASALAGLRPDSLPPQGVGRLIPALRAQDCVIPSTLARSLPSMSVSARPFSASLSVVQVHHAVPLAGSETARAKRISHLAIAAARISSGDCGPHPASIAAISGASMSPAPKPAPRCRPCIALSPADRSAE
ncbi:hypothetical protein IP79_05120 [Porphyrobacter sp. AAP60]|nr:hypothetical protein IP79_05120 [Porphyrobacter sp. AAP60]